MPKVVIIEHQHKYILRFSDGLHCHMFRPLSVYLQVTESNQI